MTDDFDDDDIDPTESFSTMEAAFGYVMDRGQNVCKDHPDDYGWVNGKWIAIPVDPPALSYVAHRDQWPLRSWRLHDGPNGFHWKCDFPE